MVVVQKPKETRDETLHRRPDGPGFHSFGIGAFYLRAHKSSANSA